MLAHLSLRVLGSLVVAAVVALGFWSNGPARASIDFIVFFAGTRGDRLDPAQWEVSFEGLQVVAEYAALYAKEGDGGYVLLSGHDQWVGTEADALERTQRRAEAVKNALIARGMPAEVISTKACGFGRPYVPTAYGVPEPQNRYVFFWWGANPNEIADLARAACFPKPA